jgi:hypothetical protein
MSVEPFTIRIFVADGDADGVRLIDRMNWTGLGIAFPRTKWPEVRYRAELARPGVYILLGYGESEDDLPRVYIGQSDSVRDRIANHDQNRDFWSEAVAFTGPLNAAHARWLEFALVRRAREAVLSRVENGNEPGEPPLSEAEREDCKVFLREMLRVMPFLGLRVFGAARPAVQQTGLPADTGAMTIIVSAREDTFRARFLEARAWWAVPIAGGRLDKVRFIAVYRSAPVSAITHYAPVKSIEPSGEPGKFRLNFAEPAIEIGPVKRGDAAPILGPRYTTLGLLQSAATLSDLSPV